MLENQKEKLKIGLNWQKLTKTDKNEGKTNIIVIIKNENPEKNLQAGEIQKNHGLYGQTLISEIVLFSLVIVALLYIKNANAEYGIIERSIVPHSLL